jgi:hypothetical protein
VHSQARLCLFGIAQLRSLTHDAIRRPGGEESFSGHAIFLTTFCIWLAGISAVLVLDDPPNMSFETYMAWLSFRMRMLRLLVWKPYIDSISTRHGPLARQSGHQWWTTCWQKQQGWLARLSCHAYCSFIRLQRLLTMSLSQSQYFVRSVPWNSHTSVCANQPSDLIWCLR